MCAGAAAISLSPTHLPPPSRSLLRVSFTPVDIVSTVTVSGEGRSVPGSLSLSLMHRRCRDALSSPSLRFVTVGIAGAASASSRRRGCVGTASTSGEGRFDIRGSLSLSRQHRCCRDIKSPPEYLRSCSPRPPSFVRSGQECVGPLAELCFQSRIQPPPL